MLIPNSLKKKAIDLNYIGLSEVAWSKNDAIELLDHLEVSSVFVLGIDVLSFQDDSYKHNFDSFYFQKADGDFQDSIKQAKLYLQNYPEGDFVFVIVT